MKMIFLSSIMFLTLSCQSNQKNNDVEWEFLKAPDSTLRACLKEQDVMKLKQVLIRCDAK